MLILAFNVPFNKGRPTLQLPPRSGAWFNIKMLSYQYRKSHYGDKTVVRSVSWPGWLHFPSIILEQMHIVAVNGRRYEDVLYEPPPLINLDLASLCQKVKFHLIETDHTKTSLMPGAKGYFKGSFWRKTCYCEARVFLGNQGNDCL